MACKASTFWILRSGQLVDIAHCTTPLFGRLKVYGEAEVNLKSINKQELDLQH